MASPRVRRIAERIHVIVAEMLERRIKDPRLGFVTVTDVRLSGDTQQATVFYTVLGEAADIDGTAAALRSATGIIRSEVGRQLGMRHTPSLAFVLDAIPENARHVDDLIAQAQARDAEIARLAAGASYAGDPDPYRRPAEAHSDAGADAVEGVSADER
jgi:ribosome-binding factor A